ncbi:hypothetical protein [Pseudonocardia oroxyli]|uniref:hypothetical protein n=1 Tax=Pseudonocardia oroxyli TaxID=366584 RepID=UPI00115FC029|nr:hypothetical protein [Pseudonocardia oroxyli]
MSVHLGDRVVVPVQPARGRLLGGRADAEAGEDVVGRRLPAGAPCRAGSPTLLPVPVVRHATSTRRQRRAA